MGLNPRPTWAAFVAGLFALTALVGCASAKAPPPVSSSQLASQGSALASLQASASAIATNHPLVIFLGDEVTAGVGASTPATRWTTLVSAPRKWMEVNDGASNSGYATAGGGVGSFSTRIIAIANQHPAMVVISGGAIDLATKKADVAIAAAVTQTFTTLHNVSPGTVIVAMDPLWYDGKTPKDLPTLTTAVQTAVGSVGGYYMDIGQPLLDHPELLSPDMKDPNDAGNAVIAAAFNSAYAAAQAAGHTLV